MAISRCGHAPPAQPECLRAWEKCDVYVRELETANANLRGRGDLYQRQRNEMTEQAAKASYSDLELLLYAFGGAFVGAAATAALK